MCFYRACCENAKNGFGIIGSASWLYCPWCGQKLEPLKPGDSETIQESVGSASVSPRKCRVCGCTDEDCSGCIERTGQPCYWVSENLCSACCDSEMPPDGELGDFLDE